MAERAKAMVSAASFCAFAAFSHNSIISSRVRFLASENAFDAF
eukprot:CAMPEP_0117531518 /NCGR_PEP_ID=MMETSP0784-20121206/38900_1 /TAXON_ID=39447 /ORGANISM="" /LENGTH=42 /DNA_ID= /DNA_START= /DNA_END= /DNA_ORIENTATION=